MSKYGYVLSFILLLLFQIIIVNSVSLWGIITPMVYILFILILPFQTPRWLVVLLGFLMGFSVDMFTGVLGLHAIASGLIAFLRMPIINVIPSKVTFEEHLRPILWDMHFKWYFQYVLYLTLIHHIVYYFLEAMSFDNFLLVLGIALLNVAFTVLLLMLFQVIFFKASKRY
ncbi:MAG TPA: hypothetical protein PLF32_05680 [Bacteroidales bacterium]|jgi:rod shape-determining protein MreD|nr:rod shape-determining protein MreD [Bacteroidales bacterium]HOF15532.1 hypothetical protein [Bacteroidales bacterium]HOR82125.1 hypothetical protein [Bacteroidales bacterium]HPJ90412.1 hypothetical protein [Bacteroidales bacterium]HQB19978.1 hypothetical protein [Bacteroidales bacterium]